MKSPTPAHALSTFARPLPAPHGPLHRLLGWLQACWVSWSERRRFLAGLEALSRLDEHALHDVGIAGCLLERIESQRVRRERHIEALLHSGAVLPR